LRGIVEEAFRRRVVLEMEPRILALAADLANELFAEGRPADLVDRYARKLPLSVICELLGLPLDDRPKFTAWASCLTRFTNIRKSSISREGRTGMSPSAPESIFALATS
jgi:cytochrome P450 PksS